MYYKSNVNGQTNKIINNGGFKDRTTRKGRTSKILTTSSYYNKIIIKNGINKGVWRMKKIPIFQNGIKHREILCFTK